MSTAGVLHDVVVVIVIVLIIEELSLSNRMPYCYATT